MSASARNYGRTRPHGEFCWPTLMRHVANSYQQLSGDDFDQTLNRIKAALEVELRSPTDNPTGRILEPE